MNAPTSAATAKSQPADSIVETEISNLVKELAKQESPAIAPTPVENDAERIRSSVGRLTSSSINELKGLTSELEELQEFLKSEVERVERDIESALAGINIIIETIAPWRGIADSIAPAGNARGTRGGPAANIPPASRAPEQSQ